MKRLNLLILLLSVFCMCLSCSKDDVDAIFDPANKDAIMPLDVSVVYGSQLTEAFNDMSVAGAIFSRLSGGKVSAPTAYVLNDQNLLSGIQNKEGVEISWPESMLSNYSLVVCCMSGGTRSFVNDQRIIVNKGKATLYIDFKRSVFQDVHVFYNAYLFPKLPDGQVDVVVRES